jgi:hypothetical protein
MPSDWADIAGGLVLPGMPAQTSCHGLVRPQMAYLFLARRADFGDRGNFRNWRIATAIADAPLLQSVTKRTSG